MVTTAGTCTTPGSATLHVYHCPFTDCDLAFWGNIALPAGTTAGGIITWAASGTTIGTYSNKVVTDVINNQSCTSVCTLGGSGGPHDGGTAENGYNPHGGAGIGDPTPPVYPRPRDGLKGADGHAGLDGDISTNNSSSTTDNSGDPAAPFQVDAIKNDELMGLGELKVLPNPASNYIDFNFTAIKNGKCDVTITDITGREVYKTQYGTNIGQNSHRIDVKNFASGTYLINISSNGGKQQIKFSKE